MNYVVNVIDDETGEVVKSFVRESMRSAQKIADGVAVNLNHERFSVVMEKDA